MTFDSWEVLIRPPEDCLEHHGIRGMKHGRRRYQNEDGTWTDEGLAARKKREGWGDKKERKLQKKIDKAERHQAKKAAKEERRQAIAEQRRKRKLSGLTDEEMKAKLERAKMEAEYRDLTRRHTAMETGAKLIGKYLDYRDAKEKNAIEANKQKLEMERLKTQRVQAEKTAEQAKEKARQAKYESKKAKQDRKAKEADVQGGLKLERKANLKKQKMEYKNYTIRGGIAKRINMFLTSGKAKEYEAVRKARGDVESSRIKSDGARDLKNRRAAQEREDSAPERKRATKMYNQQRKQQQKNRRQYEKESRRLRKLGGG